MQESRNDFASSNLVEISMSLALCDEPTRKNHDACGLGAPSEPSVFPLSVRYNRLSPASPAIQTPQVPPDGGNTHGADPRCLDGISTKLTDNHWKTNLRYCYLDETRELLSWSNSRNTGLHADLSLPFGAPSCWQGRYQCYPIHQLFQATSESITQPSQKWPTLQVAPCSCAAKSAP